MSDPDGRPGVRAGYWIVSQLNQMLDRSGRRTVVEVQPGSMLGESNSTDVNLAETEPGKDDGQGDNTLEPEGSVVFNSVGKLLPGLTAIVDEENDLSPDQSQSGPSEETVSTVEGVVELIAHGGVRKHEHHQEESQDNPRDNESGKRNLCVVGDRLRIINGENIQETVRECIHEFPSPRKGPTK